MNSHSLQPRPAVLASTDVPIGLRIADLRREIEDIQELSTIYRHQKRHPYEDYAANHGRTASQTRSVLSEGARVATNSYHDVSEGLSHLEPL